MHEERETCGSTCEFNAGCERASSRRPHDRRDERKELQRAEIREKVLQALPRIRRLVQWGAWRRPRNLGNGVRKVAKGTITGSK